MAGRAGWIRLAQADRDVTSAEVVGAVRLRGISPLVAGIGYPRRVLAVCMAESALYVPLVVAEGLAGPVHLEPQSVDAK